MTIGAGSAARLASTAATASATSGRHWPFLDLIRFGAALLVLFGHARGLLLEGIGRVEHPSIFIKGFYLLSGLQHEGVVLFFVVSGFLVGGSVWRLMQQERFDFGTYFINRFARIYLVYIPALLFVLALTIAGQHFLGETRFYAERPLDPSGIYDGWTWDQVPCHLVALQSILCIPWGANLPVWSLGYEWAFYLIAPPLFAIVLDSGHRSALHIGLAVVGLAALSWWNVEWLEWFFIWLLGVFAAHVFETRAADIRIGLAGLALCAMALVTSRLAIVPPIATDLAAAFGIAVAVACRGLVRIGSSRAVARGAAFSYSLYLIHLPTGIFIGAIFEKLGGWPSHLVQPDAKGLLGFASMATAILVVAYLFARATEDHTAAFRRKLLALRAGLRRAPSAS